MEENISTYKIFMDERIQRNWTSERAPFWCTALIFYHYGGKCFVPPVLVHQRYHYTQYLHWGIPIYWLLHNILLIYMYFDGCLESISQFSPVCAFSTIKPQVLFYGGHSRCFKKRAMHILFHHIQDLILKVSVSVHDQSNGTGSKLRLKKLCVN